MHQRDQMFSHIPAGREARMYSHCEPCTTESVFSPIVQSTMDSSTPHVVTTRTHRKQTGFQNTQARYPD